MATREVVGYRWRVVAFTDGSGRHEPRSERATVGFTRDGYVVGNDTVNALQGRYRETDRGYRVSDVASTLVGTTRPPRVMRAVDAVFFAARPGAGAQQPAVRVILSGTQLRLAHGGYVLTLRRVGPQPDFLPASASNTTTASP